MNTDDIGENLSCSQLHTKSPTFRRAVTDYKTLKTHRLRLRMESNIVNVHCDRNCHSLVSRGRHQLTPVSTYSLFSRCGSSKSLSTTSSSSSSSPPLFSSCRRLWSSISLLLFVVVVICESSVVTEETSLDLKTADEYLSRFGYYQHKTHHQQSQDSSLSVDINVHVIKAETAEGSTEEHTEAERHLAIERLQSFFHIPVTGQLDKDTEKVIKTARCGAKDVGDEDEEEDVEKEETSGDGEMENGAKSRKKRYSIRHYPDGAVARWEVKELTWRITRPTRQISESDQRNIMRKAFAVWAKYVPIRFVEDSGSDVPDINIQFARREHGTGNDEAFDGTPTDRPNVLAHAFHPGLSPKTLAGDVHFDDDDDWTDLDFLLTVAVHELGHSMGLDHSTDSNSIMFARYQEGRFDLGQDDVNGINALYGPGVRGRTTYSPPVTERPRTRAPYATVQPEWRTTPSTPAVDEMCASIQVDALFQDPTTVLGRVFIAISGDHVHKLTEHGRLLLSQPLATVFPELPASPDVAFTIRGRKTIYFIKDNKLWAYQGSELEEGYPKSLEAQQFPERPRFAVTLNERDGSSRLLLFGANYWWSFDVDRPTTVRYDPISRFSSAMPRDVMFATTWADNHLYAVSEDSYVIMDIERRQLTHDRPIAGRPEWLHALCENGSRASASFSMITLISLLSLATIVKSILL